MLRRHVFNAISLPLCSCVPLVGQQADGLRPLLPRRLDGVPHRGPAASLPRLLLGVHRRGVLPAATGRPSLHFSLFASCAISGSLPVAGQKLPSLQTDEQHFASIKSHFDSTGDEARELGNSGAEWEGGVGVHAVQAQGEVVAQTHSRENSGQCFFFVLCSKEPRCVRTFQLSQPLVRT